MNFLADAGVSMAAVRVLREHGHGAVRLREQGLQRLPDDAIMEKARGEGRIVLTFDLDFTDLLALGLRDSPSVIIFRLHNETPASVNPRLLSVAGTRLRPERGRVDYRRGEPLRIAPSANRRLRPDGAWYAPNACL